MSDSLTRPSQRSNGKSQGRSRQAGRGGTGWLGFIPQLFFFILLPLIALLVAITLGSISLHQKAMRDMAGEQDLRTVRATARVLDQELNVRAQALGAVAQRLADGVSPALVLASPEEQAAGFDRGMAVFSAGQRIAGEDAALWDALKPEVAALLPAGQPGQLVYSPAVHAPQQATLLILAAAQGGAGQVVVGAFTPQAIAAQALAGLSGHQTLVTLVDGTGQVLYQTGETGHADIGNGHPGIAEALRGESGITYLKIAGKEYVVAFSPVAPLGWGLVIEQPWEAMASPLLRTTQMAPLVLVPALLLMLVGLWFGLRQIVQPLRSLESQANAMAWKNFSAMQAPVGGIAEIQRLQATLTEMARRVQAAQENLRSYIGAITTGQEDERRRLAREIHDDTLQSIIALNQRVQLARLDLGEHPASASLAEIQGLTEQTIANLRRLVRALRPAYLEELGLSSALEILARETGQADGAAVAYAQSGEERRLPPEVELTLYRMAQEALNNAVYHGQPAHVTLELAYLPQEVRVSVQDDGRGFRVPDNPGEFAPAGHFGLLGMYERAELSGASFEIASQPGKGTRVDIRYPALPPGGKK